MNPTAPLPKLGISRRIAPCVLAAGLLVGTTSAQSGPESGGEDVVTLPEFSVSTAADTGYLATASTSGTRIATEIINLPYSVQVLTEDFIKDFQLLDLDEQVAFVGGMSAGDKDGGGGGLTRVRGFFVPYFRNGFYRRQAPDSSSIARVEVIRGPQSAVYGRVSPGGVVNYISKKPRTRFASGLTYSVGTYDYSRVDGYVTGPLIANKLYYRVDATYYDTSRPTDFFYNRTRNISGGITYKLSADTSVTFEYEHTFRRMNNSATPFPRWIDANGFTQGSVYDIPDRALADRLTAFNSTGAHSFVDRLNNSYYLQLEHRLAPDLSLRANIGYSTRDYERVNPSALDRWDTRVSRYASQFAVLQWTDETQGIWTADRVMSRVTIDSLQAGSQIDLTKTWRGAGNQRTLLTFDLFEDDDKQKMWALRGAALNNALAALGLNAQQQAEWKRPDPFNPGFSGYLPTPQFNGNIWPMEDSGTFNLFRTYYGGLVNHTAELLDGRLVLTASGRHDWSEFKRQQPRSTNPTLRETVGDVQKFTYSGGVNYHIIPRKLVGYVSYGTAFDPQPQADRNTGALLGNKTAKGVDIGLKGSLLEDTLSYTLSAYRIDQEGEAVANPDNPTGSDPDLPALVAGGATRGTGVTLDLSGRITENLSLLGNFSIMDIWITRNDRFPALVGTPPMGGQNPAHRSGAIAARYNFTRGPLKGLRLGANYQYASSFLRIAGSATSSDVYMPRTSQMGLLVGYGFKAKRGPRVDLNLNVSNVFNQQIITFSSFAPPGREFKFTTSLSF